MATNYGERKTTQADLRAAINDAKRRVEDEHREAMRKVREAGR